MYAQVHDFAHAIVCCYACLTLVHLGWIMLEHALVDQGLDVGRLQLSLLLGHHLSRPAHLGHVCGHGRCGAA
jgi:hypothetical protein